MPLPYSPLLPISEGLMQVRTSRVAQMVKNLPAVQETWVRSLGWEDSPGGWHGNPLQYFLGGFPGGSDGKASACNAGDPGSIPGLGRFPWRRKWQPTPVLLPRKFHGWKSLVGYSPWGHEESDMTERLHFHFSLSCIGEGNGNPLQCSCLENPRDGGAWWASVYGVAQNWT